MAKKVRFDVVQAWSQDSNASAPKPDTHLNYFTCTLGGAARWNKDHTHPFQTVNDLIDEQAKELRQRPALNFAGGCHAVDGKEMKSGMFTTLPPYSSLSLPLSLLVLSSMLTRDCRFHLPRTPELLTGDCSKTS